MLLNRVRAEEKMKKYGLEGIIATSAANVFYTSDLNPYGNSYVLLPYDKNIEPVIIVSISSPTPVILSSQPWISDIRYFGKFYTTTNFAKEPLTDAEHQLIKAQESWEKEKEKDPIAILIRLLKERGLTKGKIGVDESNLSPEHYFWQKIKSDLPRIEAVRGQDIFREIRIIKSKEEIKRIQEALRITETAWSAALEQTREGMTEIEFAEIYQKTILSEGGRISSKGNFYGPPISFGRRTAFVDIADPSDYKLKKGDIIRFDGGACYKGYPSDMARSAVLGHPSEKLQKYFNAILEGERLAIEMAKPGVVASDIYNSVVEKVREKGIPHYKRHHVGHGWGIEGYETPIISPEDQTMLEEDMLLDFETPYYEVGWGGLLNEDVVVITKNEPRYLTEPSNELYVIE